MPSQDVGTAINQAGESFQVFAAYGVLKIMSRLCTPTSLPIDLYQLFVQAAPLQPDALLFLQLPIFQESPCLTPELVTKRQPRAHPSPEYPVENFLIALVVSLL